MTRSSSPRTGPGGTACPPATSHASAHADELTRHRPSSPRRPTRQDQESLTLEWLVTPSHGLGARTNPTHERHAPSGLPSGDIRRGFDRLGGMGRRAGFDRRWPTGRVLPTFLPTTRRRVPPERDD